MTIDLNELDKVDQLEEQKSKMETYEGDLLGALKIVRQVKTAITNIQKDMAEGKAREAGKKYDDFVEMSEEYHRVKDELLSFPERIKVQKEHLAGLEEVLDQAKQELKLLEDLKMLEITNATDEDGKKKYSNNTARDAALGKWKQHDLDYQETRDEVKEATRNLESAKFEQDRIYNEFKSYQSIAGMLEARMKMLG